MTSFNIDLSKFAKTIKLDGGFFDNNLKTISPDIPLITSSYNSQFVVTMTYGTGFHFEILPNLYYING